MKRRKLRRMILRLVFGWLPLFLATVLLYQWSRDGDPRFYYFLNTRPGQVMSKTFGWASSPVPFYIEDKTDAEMTPEELMVKRGIEEMLMDDSPSHRLTFKNGHTMKGRLVRVTKQYVKFEEDYGDSGSVTAVIKRDRIAKLERMKKKPPLVTYRDVLLKMEFQDMDIYKRAPYTIVTDETYFNVEGTMHDLRRLHDEFLAHFQKLAERTQDADNIHVLFFSDEDAFRSYQEEYAPHMENTAGFYSPWVDLLVFFNQDTSDQVREFQEKLRQEEAKYRQFAKTPAQRNKIEKWKKQISQNVERIAEQYTRSTVRHEGAHQLMVTYGVHSQHHVENAWLIEGLATYCETPRIGGVDEARVRGLRGAEERAEMIPLRELVNLRSAQGLVSVGDPNRVEIAYSEAWLLTHMLMQERYRDGFFNYLQYLRDPENFDAINRQDRIKLLARFVGMTPSQLENSWQRHLARL